MKPQLQPERKRELLGTAEELARELAEGGADRGQWRTLLDALYLAPGAGRDRREEVATLAAALPGSWLRQRSKQSGRQLRQVSSTSRRVMQGRYPDADLRFLLGWTARLLDIEAKERRRGAPPPGPRGHRPTPPGPSPRAGAAVPAREAPTPAPGPRKEVWSGATVSYEAGGGGSLRAVGTDRRIAEAAQADARRLIEALSEGARSKMTRRRNKKPIRAEVEVEPRGRSWRLVAIREGG